MASLPPRWLVAVSAAVAAAILGDSLMYAVLPVVWPSLGLQLTMVGVLLSLNRWVRLVSNPIAGAFMGRYGVRGPFLASVFCAALTTALYGLGGSFWVLALARVAWGISWSFLRLGGYLVALDLSADGNRGYYLGFFYGITRFGSFVSTLLGGVLTDVIGFRPTTWLFAAVTLAGGLAVWRERPPARPAPEITPTPNTGVAARAEPAWWRLSGRSAWLLAAVYLMGLLNAMLLSGLVTSSLGLWLVRRLGDSVQVALLTIGVASLSSWLLSARFLMEVCGAPLSGRLSDHIGRVPVLVSGGVLAALFLLALSAAENFVAIATAAVALFAAAAATLSTAEASAGDLAPPGQRARAMSWYAAAVDTGAATGPLAGYMIAGALDLAWIYRGSAALLLLGTLAYGAAALIATRPSSRPAAAPSR